MIVEDMALNGKGMAIKLPRRLADAARRRPAVQRLELRVRRDMSASDVLPVIHALEAVGVEAYVIGGWGVDALVGRQTRRHRDLDLAMAEPALDDALRALASLGFSHRFEQVVPEAPLPRSLTCVARGRRVDLHPLGGTPEEASLTLASGTIAGRTVSCLSAETQLAHHRGYPSRIVDIHDVELVRRVVSARGR